MNLGIVSDTHGRVATTARALALLRGRGAEIVIHCGDIDDAATVGAFDGWTAHFVFGNCDWDRDELASAIREIGATLHESFGHIELSGKQIAWTHGDNTGLLRELESCDHYDFLFYGHTHVAEQHRTGKTCVVNPGALHRARTHSCAILNISRADVELLTIE